MYEDDDFEEDTEAPSAPVARAAPRPAAARPGVGALAAFDPEFMRGLFPEPPQEEPMPRSPVDPRAQWLAFSAGVLKGGPRFGSELSSGLSAMAAQRTKDAQIEQLYQTQAMRMKLQRQVAEQRRAQQQMQQMQGWTRNMLGSVAPLVSSGQGPLDPAQVAQAVQSAVQTGQVPPQLAERFLGSLPQDPEALRSHLTNMMRAQADPFTAFKAPTTRAIGPNSSIVSISADGSSAKPLYTNRTPKENAFLGLLQAAGIDPNSPEGKQLIQARLRKEATHAPAPGVKVDLRQENAESKAVGEGFGKMFNDLQRDAMQAQNRLGSLSRMSQLMEGVSTGKLTPLITDIQGYAAELGIKLSDKLGEKEAIEALTNEMALQARDPSGGAGMPGAMSDQDRNFLVRITPGLSKSPEGNRLIIETQRRLHRRSIDVARLAAAYRRRNGTLDDGFLVELEQWSAANPLFADLQRRMGAEPARPVDPNRAQELLRRAEALRKQQNP